jgi:hypothetical protein
MFEYLSQFFSQVFLEAISDEIQESKEKKQTTRPLYKPKSMPIIVDCTEGDLSNLRKSISFSNYISGNGKHSQD